MAQYQAIWPDGFVVRWRDITEGEYRALTGSESWRPYPNFLDFDLAHRLYSRVLINGPDPAVAPAGICQFVAVHQMVLGPYSGNINIIKEKLNGARLRVQNDFFLQAKALIAAAFHVPMEQMDTWTADEILMRLAQTEVLFGQILCPPRTEQKSPAGPSTQAPPGTEVKHVSVTSKRRR